MKILARGAHRKRTRRSTKIYAGLTAVALLATTLAGVAKIETSSPAPAHKTVSVQSAQINPLAFLALVPKPRVTQTHAAATVSATPTPSIKPVVTVSAPAPVPQPTNTSPLSGTLSCSGLEQLWDTAGGDPSKSFIAAEIAMAESGGNQWAHSPTDDIGYWQINSSWGPGYASYDPLTNAKAAVYISHDGTDWSPWTTYTSGAYIGKC